MLKRNVKTTLWGLGAIFTAVGGALVAFFDGDPATTADLPTVFAAIAAGIGLIKARDEQPDPEEGN